MAQKPCAACNQASRLQTESTDLNKGLIPFEQL